ncbi:MAG: hypothetical protein RDV48_21790 [Candidatus Eremiobacteraeota bacterium]|nr:hypothetical protein [Candidatus Eremiobacteraeota bacterium]
MHYRHHRRELPEARRARNPVFFAFLCLFFGFLIFPLQAACSAENAGSRHSWRFARDYTVDEVFSDQKKAEDFIKNYLVHEGEFFSIVRHPGTGFSYDGFNLDKITGKPGSQRLFSAPSKECLDVALCVKALTGDSRAALVVSPKDPSGAPQEALKILERKMDGYEQFLKKNPGYAGYLPWYICEDEVKPTRDWRNEFPGLDNGEWLWTLLVAERVLARNSYSALAKRYHAYNARIRENVVPIFYDAKAGKVRADIRFTALPGGGYAYGHAPGKLLYLTGEHGVHEGMMLIMYVCLFGKGLPAGAAERIWSDIRMKRIENKYGTTWEGWYGSSHEEWAYLVLPLRDLHEYRSLFRIREQIRTQNARERGYPGFATSCLLSRDAYIDKAGIEDITSLPLRNNHTFALYGAFPLVLECVATRSEIKGDYGLAWLLNMLQADRMQGPLGAGEGGTNDGTSVADVKTIDGSFTIALALAGGLERETAEMLRHEGCYERFAELMRGEYLESFGAKPLYELVDFALPGCQVPRGKLGDYK